MPVLLNHAHILQNANFPRVTPFYLTIKPPLAGWLTYTCLLLGIPVGAVLGALGALGRRGRQLDLTEHRSSTRSFSRMHINKRVVSTFIAINRLDLQLPRRSSLHLMSATRLASWSVFLSKHPQTHHPRGTSRTRVTMPIPLLFQQGMP